MKKDDELIKKLKSELPENFVIINSKRRTLNMHHVFDYELDNIGSANLQLTVNLALFCLMFGVLIGLAASLLTNTFTSPYVAACFVAGAVSSLVLSIFFSIRSVQCYYYSQRQIAAIKQSSEEKEDIILNSDKFV